MKTRIGLVFNQSLGRSVTKFVEVADAKELAAEPTKAGAKRAVLDWRDRIGDGHTECQPFALAELGDTPFARAAVSSKDGMQKIFFDPKG